VGKFRNGLPNGRGLYTLPNGEKYDGEFVDNKRTGQGTYTWPDGRKYVGQFQNDRPSGQGTYTWADGRRYVGEFRNGEANGQGDYTWPDGRHYVGVLRDDLPNGHGTMTLADGRQLAGEFRNGDYLGTTPGSTYSTAAGTVEIPLSRHSGTFTVPATVNGVVALDFYLDTGAADVSVPAYVFEALKRAGSISKQDMIGWETYQMADGTAKKSTLFLVRSLKLGPLVLDNVRASVAATGGPPLLGMSFLGRFATWSVDNARGVLTLK
jgi:clan AA aspartic protease (TIGR02281 family)